MSINRFDNYTLSERLVLENTATQWFHSRKSASEVA